MSDSSPLLDLSEQGYESIAKDFSASRKRQWADLEIFLNYVKNGDNLLDLGCGNGRLVDFLSDLQLDYLGIDKSPSLVELAQKAHPEVTFQTMDALDLKLEKGSFDQVLSVAVLNHFPTRDLQLKVLQGAFRVLKPGGHLLLSNWNMWNINNPKGLAAFTRDKDELSDQAFVEKYQFSKSDLASKDVLTVWGKIGVLYYYAFEKEELEMLLRETGFEVISSEYMKDGQKDQQSTASNIVTVVQKPVESNPTT